jgi:peptidoglycan/LPS O-acetylase OafA/YrhL
MDIFGQSQSSKSPLNITWGRNAQLTHLSRRFRSSLVLYLTQAGLAHLKSKIRMAILVFLIIWVHQMGRWEMILFYGGFLCADLGFHRSPAPTSVLPTDDSTAKRRSSRAKPVIYVCVFVLGLYLGCQPQKRAGQTPGWATLVAIMPDYVGNPKRYWPGWGAILLVWSTSCYKPLQRLFDNRLAQYLGKISFSLYIVHGAVTHVIGYPLMNISDGILGRDEAIHKAIGFGIGFGTTLFFTVWFADLFTRAVDEPSVRFAKWVEEKSTISVE